jgi:HTH-type transcriptional regulator, sugar sensing transcriptional regulator
MDFLPDLKKLGFSDKEALVYAKALELNSFSIASMATMTGIKRPTCYLIVDNLIQKGLISIMPRGRKSLYCAESPETIIKNMEKKVELAKQITPRLQQIKAKDLPTPTIKFFTGRLGVEAIYSDILKSTEKTELFSMTPAKQIVEVVGRDFFNDWIKKRVDKKIFSKTLVPFKDKNNSVIVSTNEKEMRETRYLPKDFSLDTTLGVYGDKVAFFSSKKDNIGFIIKSTEFSETMRNFFEHLWKESK